MKDEIPMANSTRLTSFFRLHPSSFPFEVIHMSETSAPHMTLEAIRSVPLFAPLDDEAAKRLRSLLTVREVPAGTPLFRTGDKGDAMYLIERGRVRISVQ